MSIKRLFVANRGEIAVRIIRTAKELGIETVLGVSQADRTGLGVKMADRTVVLGPAPSSKSYLDARLVVHAALSTGCDALHPGYGFLSENPELCHICEENGIAFVGPRAETIEMLGDKLKARALASESGVKTVPGTDHVSNKEEAVRAAEALGYPIVMKASAGGGGRGMYRANSPEELLLMFGRASLEAESAFGDGRLYLERFVERARHVEVQVIGDGEGGVVHFGERDCSIQRRYQKLIEEAPSTAISQLTRDRLHNAAVKLISHSKYRNAGTVEFLYDSDREDFYFMEVNSRIQVEHPVTEEVTGIDLIACQLRVAGGDGIGVSQDDVNLNGHAIECRINAEDPHNDFSPSPGLITKWQIPRGRKVRLDTHACENYLIPPFYDSMIGKLIVKAPTRDEAIDAMVKAISEFRIEGPKTTLRLAAFIVDHRDFRINTISTRWLEKKGLSEFLECGD